DRDVMALDSTQRARAAAEELRGWLDQHADLVPEGEAWRDALDRLRGRATPEITRVLLGQISSLRPRSIELFAIEALGLIGDRSTSIGFGVDVGSPGLVVDAELDKLPTQILCELTGVTPQALAELETNHQPLVARAEMDAPRLIAMRMIRIGVDAVDASLELA